MEHNPTNLFSAAWPPCTALFIFHNSFQGEVTPLNLYSNVLVCVMVSSECVSVTPIHLSIMCRAETSLSLNAPRPQTSLHRRII